MAKVIQDRAPARRVPPARHVQLGLSADDVVGMYRTVLLTRLVDQKAWNLTRTGKARFYIPAEGQEAAQVGSAWALRAGHDLAHRVDDDRAAAEVRVADDARRARSVTVGRRQDGRGHVRRP